MAKKMAGVMMVAVVLAVFIVGCGQQSITVDSGMTTTLLDGSTTTTSTTTTTTTLTTTTTVPTKTISGRVTDLWIGDPLPGAQVYAGGRSTAADATGNYTLQGIPLTNETITVQLGGYAPVTIFTTKETVALELALLPEVVTSIPFGYSINNSTINGEVRNENGSTVGTNEPIRLQHRYYYARSYVDNKGRFSMGCYLDPSKFPLTAFVSMGNSAMIGIKQVTINNTGAVDIGTLEVRPNPGIVTGEVAVPYLTGSKYVSWGIMDNQGRWPSYFWETGISGGVFTQYLPATPAPYKYFLMANAYGPGSVYNSAQYIENIEIGTGETRTINFSLPNIITIEAPADGATLAGTTPTFSWTPPDHNLNLFLVFLYDSGGSGLIKWVGVTDQTSLTYPSFPVGSGMENLNLGAEKGYLWQVYGYYIPGFNLHSNAVRLEAAAQDLKASSTMGGIGALSIVEAKQALEQTSSGRVYFATGSVPHVTTTTTTTTSTTSTSTTTTTVVGMATTTVASM